MLAALVAVMVLVRVVVKATVVVAVVHLLGRVCQQRWFWSEMTAPASVAAALALWWEDPTGVLNPEPVLLAGGR